MMTLAARAWRLARAQFGTHLNEPEADTTYRTDKNTPYAAEYSTVLAEYYANLELPYGAPAEAVKTARRRLLKAYHPDRFACDFEKVDVAEQLVKTLNRAHDELLRHLEGERHA